MMKLLIVDDEPIEREGMQAILQKAFPELMIYQAKNGKLAIEFTNTIQPDLILMDIMMPGMTGLEAIERIQAEHPTIKFVMVTAFDTFSYARQAIKLGVKDYLLKPSKASEIVSTVGKVLDECRQELKARMISQMQQENWKKALTLAETDIVTQLIFDHIHELQIEMLVDMLDAHSAYEKFVMVVTLPERAEHYYVRIKEKVHETSNAWVGALYVRQLPIIVFRDNRKSFRWQVQNLAKAILSLDKEQLRADWIIGVGEIYESLDKVRQSYQEALIALMDTTLAAKVRFYSDVPANSLETDNPNLEQQQKAFFDNIRLGDWESIRSIVLNTIQQYESERKPLIYTQQRVLELLWIVSRVMNDMRIETDAPFFSLQAQDYRQLRTETLQMLRQMNSIYNAHFDQAESDKIQQIQQYIRDHSHEDISLETLAQKINLNPIYISKMFKEKLGINYIDFLTQCRIEKAKKLLNDPERSLKEITYEIGYNEPNYFSKVFKKMCGISPKEYRKTLLSKKTISR
ncbi:response regulator [Cytobacillus depressus]|uniref:Response regulator n=1 Tax=Cytobacillus depressus TaxID=1602942 RepID=A0A6L3V475_9BACI|nr:response regulator [Cytobacillus depressus]KAB2332175.1 response regulator [Cytobacillus depressus]